MVFLVLFLVLILLLVLLFDLLAWIFSDLGAVVICIFSVLGLVRFVSVLSTFPGSFWFIRRQLQLDFNRDYCSRVHQNTEKLTKFL